MAAQPKIRRLTAGDPVLIAAAFACIGRNTTPTRYRRTLAEQRKGTRTVLLARLDERCAGYLTVNRASSYPAFAQDRIPEIQDLNVLPAYRRRGIATALLEQAEALVRARSPVVGIGVGMDPDYGAAPRLYVLRG